MTRPARADTSGASLIDAMQERLTASALEFYKKHPNNAPQHVVIAMCDELLIYRGEPKKCTPPAETIPSANVSQWIPVSERQPEGWDDVLVAHPVFARRATEFYGVALRSASHVRIYVSDPSDTSMRNAFWMYLPKGPA